MIKEPQLLSFPLNPFYFGDYSISTISYFLSGQLIYETKIIDYDGEAFIEHNNIDNAKKCHLNFISSLSCKN